MENESSEEDLFHFNVGGWLFSVPKIKLAQFQESLLWKEASILTSSENVRLFIDRDGFTFRHVHYYLHTSKLSFSSCSELNLLYEQALVLQLTPLLQALDNLKEGKHHLRIRPAADIPITERASMNYWKTRKCNSRLSEFPVKSPAFTGLHDKAPLGLIDTPLIDTEEEIHYCFLAIDLVAKYPTIINDDNLLWISEDLALIECGCSEFRFIANFLHSGKILLPDSFSSIEILETEVEQLGIPELTDAVKVQKNNLGHSAKETPSYQLSVQHIVNTNGVTQAAARPWYTMALSLLVKYPDSALGQLHMESTVDGRKLYITGNGVLFQHVKNWLGSCRLPLTDDISELYGLCTYLDKKDITYEPMKEALKKFLRKKAQTEIKHNNENWKAETKAYSLDQIVKVYVGSHWYATHLKTLLKHPELLFNYKKAHWITCGQSLLIQGDGQIFRHILNFLRLGKLVLPSEFKEWSLLCEEAKEYRIPSLLEALYQCDAYRLWVKENASQYGESCARRELNTVKDAEYENNGSPKEPSHNTTEFNECQLYSWRKLKSTPRRQEKKGHNGNHTKMISVTKGTKRSSNPKSERWNESTEMDISSKCSKFLLSPPRKRAAKTEQTRISEYKETTITPMHKLMSLVKEWDMLNSKAFTIQQVPTTSSDLQGNYSYKAFSDKDKLSETNISFWKTGNATQENKHKAQASVSAQEHFLKWYYPGIKQSHTVKTSYCFGEEEYPIKEMAALKNWCDQEQKEISKHLFCAFTNNLLINEKTSIEGSSLIEQELDNTGFILKVEHPSLVGAEGSCLFFEDSVIYTVKLVSLGTQQNLKDIPFLSFNMSHEEMFYARKCHFFLTDIILDSIRHKDPKEITAKLVHLVNKLWTLQITSKQFVEDLLNIEFFKDDKHIYEKLHGWAELTLPFAWKYSDCIDLLIKKGYYKSISLSVLTKYLQ
ncbi:BTB/POZ domain-containing protein KCTD19 [Rhinatrema bivittatum]|uniref:BTB/POZ domain-containing protein KCTD19 n=1 Tax=Rhinatrema bivittatum TaxID=194408 RepID=UPI00112E9313|nr:BTB/POZ domain-containing protein KCTD19 [Rhinatrema bivittatum]